MSDYYPFGMLMPGRSYSATNGYRYGFNGKENDNEVKGEGNQQDYGMRIYDPRLGKFLSVDPLTMDYPMLTPYQYASNNPIQNIDIDGLEGEPSNGAPTLPNIPATNLPREGGLSRTVINPQGRLERSGSSPLGTLPAGSNQLDAPTRRISQEEFEGLIPPHCTGVNIDADGTTATIYGINGTHWQVSILKPELPAPTPMQKEATKFQLKEGFRLKGSNLIYDAKEFKNTNSDGKKEYFYRAMSLTEFNKTGGYIESRPGRKDYPFITSDLAYLTNRNSFIWGAEATSYDIIIRYTVPKGTKAELFSIGESHPFSRTDPPISGCLPVLKPEKYTTFGGVSVPNINIGFPNSTGWAFFNGKIISKDVILTNASGLKDK